MPGPQLWPRPLSMSPQRCPAVSVNRHLRRWMSNRAGTEPHSLYAIVGLSVNVCVLDCPGEDTSSPSAQEDRPLPEHAALLPIDEAQARLLALLPTLPEETVEVEAALGRGP